LIDFLRSFPIQSYWDTLKGEYRTGVLGDNIQNLSTPAHLSLVTWVDRNILQNGKVLKIKQPIVDNSLLFMLMLVAVQDISELSEYLLSVSGEYQEKYNFTDLTDVIRQQNISPIADTEAAYQAAELESKIIALQIELNERQRKFSKLSDLEQAVFKEMSRTSLHQNLLKNIHDSATRINSVYENKWQVLQQIAESNVNADFDGQQRLLEQEFQNSLAELQDEINTTFAVIRFRAEEEKRAINLIDEVASRVATAQVSAQEDSTDEILSVLSTEISNAMKEIGRDPWLIWTLGRLLLSIVVGTVFVIELSRSLHFLFHHWQRKSKSLFSQQQFLPSLWNRVFGTQPSYSHKVDVKLYTSFENGDQIVSVMEEESLLIFGNSNIDHNDRQLFASGSEFTVTPKEQLLKIARELFVAVDVHAHPYLKLYGRFAKYAVTPLPNLLFYGPAGCGKSETAKLLAHYICQDKRAKHEKSSGYIVFSGADLLALGDEAGQYVRELFQKYGKSYGGTPNSKQSQTTILIIDEADEIICTRDTIVPLQAAPVIRSKQRAVNVPPEEETPKLTYRADSPSAGAPSQQLDQWQHSMSNSAPHHVLYSLLEGLRNPNIALSVIFTTRLPVRNIDPAVLDRIDHVLPFPRPSPSDTLQYLLTHFLEVMEDIFPNSIVLEELRTKIVALQKEQSFEELLQPVIAGDMWKICQPLFGRASAATDDDESLRDDVSVSSAWSGSSTGSRRQSLRLLKRSVLTNANAVAAFHGIPERNIRPRSGRVSMNIFGGKSLSSSRSSTQQFVHEQETCFKDISLLKSSFEFEACLQLLVLHSCRIAIDRSTNSYPVDSSTSHAAASNFLTWSYRDLHKHLMNLRYAALCSEHCQITTFMWIQGLMQAD
jgi:DNA polymerase III delta prime subunit